MASQTYEQNKLAYQNLLYPPPQMPSYQAPPIPTQRAPPTPLYLSPQQPSSSTDSTQQSKSTDVVSKLRTFYSGVSKLLGGDKLCLYKCRGSTDIVITEDRGKININFDKDQTNQSNNGKKPHGLWMSEGYYEGGHTWINICINNNKEWIIPTECRAFYKIKLNKEKILIIESDSEFDSFEQEYSVKDYGTTMINWKRVAEKYSGISISYLPDKIQDWGMWYTAWQCSSQCVWEQDAIETIEKINVTDLLESYKSDM